MKDLDPSDFTKKFAEVKEQYDGQDLHINQDINQCPAKPSQLFNTWLDQAIANKNIKEPNAMCISTVSEDGHPHSRMVLLKEVVEEIDGSDAAGFVFYTNYESDKAQQLAKNPFMAMNFWWPHIYKQVRIEGKVKKWTTEAADKYFASRNRESRIGAWASPQSREIKSFDQLEKLFQKTQEKFKDKDVPRPKHWGGYILDANFIEFWEGKENRLHYRLCYSKNKDNKWQKKIIAP